RAPREPSAESAIEVELNKLTEMSFIEQPFKDVVQYLANRHGIPIVLKLRKLQDVDINPDTPITKDLKGIRLRSALNLILDELDLMYSVKDAVLQTTAPAVPQSTLEIRVYACRALLDWPLIGVPPAGGGAAGAEAAPAAGGAPPGFAGPGSIGGAAFADG